MTPAPTVDSTPTVQPSRWQDIGSYLQGDDVRLITQQHREQLLANWEDITRQEESLDDAILIGLVGGTGVGKSTFINALAGQEVSRSSDRRPTTDRVIVYRHVRTELPGEVPTSDFAQPEVLHDNNGLEKVVLFDFPDFDSAEETHTQIIRRYLPFLDVLLIIVDDIKYADRRLYQLLSKLDHDPHNIFVLLNKTDRLEHRYGDESAAVIESLMEDLNQKLHAYSDLSLSSGQRFALAARPVYEARLRNEETAALPAFARVETMLEGFQQEKHRRVAKERNIDARKKELFATLERMALCEDNRALLEEAGSLVTGWSRELETALAAVPIEVFTDSERRGVRGARLRLVGPNWGVPFSLFFTLIGEFRRRSATQVEPTELGHRVLAHYRGYFEAIENLEARFKSEFSGSEMNLGQLQATQRRFERITPTGLGKKLREAVQHDQASVTVSRRGLAHFPAAVTLALAVWGKLHPVLESAIGQGESGLIWTSLKSLLSTLDPSFLIGTLVATIFVYLMTAGVIWLREIQKVEHRITLAEQQTREDVRACGSQAIARRNGDVQSLYAEFEQLNSLLL